MTKVNKNPVVSYPTLPSGYTEYPQAVPRQALKGKDRLHYCSQCGWVEGSPVLEPKNTPWPNNENRQSETLHRCRKCNQILAHTGDCMDSRLQF